MLLLLLDSEDAPACGGGMLGATTVWRRRYVSGSYDASGTYVRGAYSDEPACASVQPAPGTTTSVIDDGHRAPDKIDVFAANGDFNAADQHGGIPADRIWVPRYSAWYEVQSVGDQYPSHLSLVHQKVEALRLKETS